MYIYFLLLFFSYFIIDSIFRRSFLLNINGKYLIELTSYFILITIVSFNYLGESSLLLGFSLLCVGLYHSITFIIDYIFTILLIKNITNNTQRILSNIKHFLVISSIYLSFLYMNF